ncbi:aldo/keto reductase [Streptomyces sp. NPDC058653]|uniref:aldo/keto reductase n=1 Tax=Streptomyces sp. NPDC058653 TaxID=3346576 RepID=UPI00365FABC3
MRTLKLGGTGLEVPALGLGCVGLSEFYGPTHRDEAFATLRTAAELGMAFLDTSDYYGVDSANERLIGEFLAQGEGVRSRFAVATKFGPVRAPGTGELVGVRSDPAYVRAACDASLRRLGTDHIDLYYLHHPDFVTPVEETVGAMAELVAAGKVRHLGLSNVSAEELHAGHQVHPITAVQNEWSLFTREYEDSVVPLCAELGIGFVAYSPFSRGFLTGRHTSTEGLAEDDIRRGMPRFNASNAQHNAALLAPVRRIAEARGATLAQIALAWLLHRPEAHGIAVVPIPGTRSPARLRENAEALHLTLTDDELSALDPIAEQVKGERMPPAPDLDRGHDAIGDAAGSR